MRILIDLQGAQSESRYRGIGRYSLSLAVAAVSNNAEHDIHIVLNGAFGDTVSAIREALDGLLPQSHIHVWHVPLPVDHMSGGNADAIGNAELIREAAIAALAPDVVHVSSLFEGYGDNSVTSVKRLFDIPTIVTLYDLIPLMNPEIYLDPAPQYKRFYEAKLKHLRSADALVTISESAAGEADRVLGYDPARVYNISAACDAIFRPLPKGSATLRIVRQKFDLPQQFVLYTGGSDERKNLKRLVRAYARLDPAQRGQCRLVFAGRLHGLHVDELRTIAAEAGMLPSELIFTGYVSDHHLVALYNLCRFFVFPSWHEGFGLPVLEAMSCGAAVLASDASSIREIAQNREGLFDPLDVESMRERMAYLLENDTAVEALRRYSRSRAADFSWDKVGSSFLEACERVHAATPAAVRPLHEQVMRSLLEGFAVSDAAPPGRLRALADAVDRSIAPPTPKIMVDVSELSVQDLRTGIQRVTRAIVSEWDRRPPPGYRIQLVRLDRQSLHYVCANRYASDLLGHAESEDDAPLVCHAGDIFLGLDLVGDCVTLAPHWFRYFRDCGVHVAFVVYDILPVRSPHWWPGGGGRAHERWLASIVEVADSLLSISQATESDVLAWMDEKQIEHRPRLGWFHLGADIQGSSPSLGAHEHGDVVLDVMSRSVSFLMVGTLEPRKGHAQVLDAFELLWAAGEDAVLCIIGKNGWLVDDLCKRLVGHPELGSRLFWLTGVSDEFLENLYAATSCLIAASQAEGFGLPLIEAAQRGTPVLARDILVFREVAGDHAAYFQGLEPGMLRDAVLAWIAAFRADAHPRTDQMPWLTWRQSAEQLAHALLARAPEAPQSNRFGGPVGCDAL